MGVLGNSTVEGRQQSQEWAEGKVKVSRGQPYREH